MWEDDVDIIHLEYAGNDLEVVIALVEFSKTRHKKESKDFFCALMHDC